VGFALWGYLSGTPGNLMVALRFGIDDLFATCYGCGSIANCSVARKHASTEGIIDGHEAIRHEAAYGHKGARERKSTVILPENQFPCLEMLAC
jgi:hypothetical protein